MTTLTIYGASDDLIEVEGAFNDEFPYRDDEGNLLAFNDGTVLRIHYTNAGVWRISTIVTGSAVLRLDQAPEDDDDNYSDRLTLTGDIRWVVHGTGFAGVRRG
jgi:hypothetical protein